MKINKKQLGNRIKKIRIKERDTLEKFAEKIKKVSGGAVTPGKSNVSRWEKGENVPNDITLQAIADIGKITFDELLHGKSVSYFTKLIDYIKKYCEDNDVEYIESEAFFIAQDFAMFSHDKDGKLLFHPPNSFNDIDLKKVIEDYHFQLDVMIDEFTKEQKELIYKWAYDYRKNDFENNRKAMTKEEINTFTKLDRYLDTDN